MKPSSVIQARQISKSFANSDGTRRPVLEKLSLDVPHGTVVCILGASGCGKTTLLRILAGLEPVTDGAISAEIPRPGGRVGFMQQGERLLPWRTILGNAALGLELLGVDAVTAAAKAKESLTRVEMSEFASAYPREISGGMTQRVLLARMLAQEPALLLLDEPLGQLNILGRKQLATMIRAYVRSAGAAAVLVTHSVEEAIFISDYVFTLSRRPAQIVDRFSLTDASVPEGFIGVKPHECFDRIRTSLLGALGEHERGSTA